MSTNGPSITAITVHRPVCDCCTCRRKKLQWCVDSRKTSCRTLVSVRVSFQLVQGYVPLDTEPLSSVSTLYLFARAVDHHLRAKRVDDRTFGPIGSIFTSLILAPKAHVVWGTMSFPVGHRAPPSNLLFSFLVSSWPGNLPITTGLIPSLDTLPVCLLCH